jgi:signal transduction histidine kinase
VTPAQGVRRSLRLRLTALATAVLVAGLALGGAVLAAVVGRRLSDAVEASARDRARSVAATYDLGLLTRPAGPVQQLPDLGDGVLVQVQDAAGGVRASVPGALDRVLVPGRSVRGVPVRTAVVPLPGGRVVAAAPAASVAQGVRAVVVALVLTLPVLGGAAAVACWVLVGMALRPVERLRVAAAGVLPVPRGTVARSDPGLDEVGRLAATLDDLLARLDAAAARQSAFVADAAHELRSPLASARVQLEVALLAGDGSDRDWRETAQEVLEEVLRLGRLVEDLLALARADARRRAPAPPSDPVDLVPLARRMVALAAAGARVPVGVVVEAERLLVRVPADAVAQVLRNLLDNAVRHAHTRVVVTVRRRAEAAELWVADDGPGIPPEQAERVFERFARLDDARARDAGGSGLGLAIAREQAEAWGGTLELAGDGPGARFRVRLPLAGAATSG